MNEIVVYKIIGLIIALNIANITYFKLGNHGWSRYGYNNYSYIGAITIIVNWFTGFMVSVWLLVMYFKW